MKFCPVCQQDKALDEFRRMTASRDGRQRRCRDCANRLTRESRAADPERHAEDNRRWRAEHPELAKAATVSWRARNVERVAATKLAWQRANREKLLAAAREDRARNPEKYRDALAEWKSANRERVREYERVRRAARYGTEAGTLDLDALWRDSDGRCGICAEAIDAALRWPDPMSRSLDHIQPLSKGGAHDQQNVQWTHLLCNLRKGAAA